ncbi:SNF2-related protein [Mesorhizobium sp. M0579]|uniref:SNF2-related protein n=1 Tax=Mesorhizobium sp. M0579 TaxID=2956962 RepID=UPI00333DF845
MATVSQIKSKILRREIAPGDYELYKAALEWDLTDPIVIENRDDLKSAYRWRDRIEPFHHQVTNLMTFCRRLPVTLLADDVGLGKTISAGLVMSELAARGRLSKVLVVCPKLLGPQWKEELETKFDIPAQVVTGRDLTRANPKEFGAIITTYNSARLYLKDIPADRFQMLILDEAHKLRNLYGVGSPPKVALTFQKALLERRFRYVLMLTATPIQNRLWDLYSLVDLLSVARGHQNPFGSEGIFARKFIADDRDKARRLKPESKEEFRSIIYGYMSRVRRGDAKLYFPDRVVQMHKVTPTQGELDLIEAISKPIQSLNRLAQISILQALTSSPDALLAQLVNMGRNGTVPADLVTTVKGIVGRMTRSAKLDGLGNLIERLKEQNPEKWRLVVFTTRRETQTTIEAFLSGLGLKVGLINGSTGGRNQEMLKAFRANPPGLNVIVSTEAGSEGVNLQVANVLVNFDLPWNPMIVEQRIGRIQRLASEHASVGIFNMVLTSTFEEYIVGRLMEKLQLASHAIGDIESLLEASGVGGDDDENGMDEKIRALVVAALAGKDTEAAVRLADQSIENAKSELERERSNIDSMLGSLDGAEHIGPRTPSLPDVKRSMGAKEFVRAAFIALGGKITEVGPDIVLVDHDGHRERVLFDGQAEEDSKGTKYVPGSAAFARLVTRLASTGVHKVNDQLPDAERATMEVGRNWIQEFGGVPKFLAVTEGRRSFIGNALVRVRATVQHDSYERLVDVECTRDQHITIGGRSALAPVAPILENASDLGVDSDIVMALAKDDAGIAEFCRFYLERRDAEVHAAGGDERKSHKLYEEFTPRLEMSFAGLEGDLSKTATIRVTFRLDGENEYSSILSIEPTTRDVVEAPEMRMCATSRRRVPADCLGRCAISGAETIKHLLATSEMSARQALPAHTIHCSVSGRLLLSDEVEQSAISGSFVARDLLKSSEVSGKRAEAVHFAKCDITGADVLGTELIVSDISGKRYRLDETARSALSGRTGHRREFLTCHETRQVISKDEAEQCDLTLQYVRRGVLATCAVSGRRALPSLMGRCSQTGQIVLTALLVSSSVSATKLLKSIAVESAGGTYCAPKETKICTWSGAKAHPDDILPCSLTGQPVHVRHLTETPPRALVPLKEMLEGARHNSDGMQAWDALTKQLAAAMGGGRCKIIAATLSGTTEILAARAEQRTYLGLKTTHVGVLFDLRQGAIVGRIATGKPTAKGWLQDAA